MLLKFWLVLFLILAPLKHIKTENYKLNYDFTKNLTEEHVILFLEELRKVCLMKNFIKKIVSHNSYPLFGTEESWGRVCTKIKGLENNKKEIINFLQKNLKLKLISKKKGLLTGYYEPFINVSWKKNNSYKYPLIKKKKKFLGQTRESIEKNYEKEDVLIWTNDYIDLFFLQIQGSGIGIFKDKSKIKIDYNGNNNLKYESIGKIMVKKKLISKKELSLFSIKKWLRANEKKAKEILHINQRYIFFKTSKKSNDFSIGSSGRKLIPKISVAIDKNIYPYGVPFLLKTSNKKYNLLALSTDTGSAIKGPNRADLFAGRGTEAEELAGNLKQKLLLFILIPKN